MKRAFWNLTSALKNGYLAKKKFITQRNAISNIRLLDLLWDEGYIAGYKVEDIKLTVFLKYNGTDQKPSLNNIYPISKPSKRLYFSSKQLWKLKSTNKLFIVSTNQGLKSLLDCKKLGLGGELVLAVL